MKDVAKKAAFGSLATGIALALITFFLLQASVFFNLLLIVSLLIAFVPLLALQYWEFYRVKQIEQYLPDFLRDVAESNRSGITLAKAVENATIGHYGALTGEMKTVASQISWGIPFEDALDKFGKRIKSKLVRQTVLIIIESYKSGGDIADILETVSDDIRRLKTLESERRSELRVYVISTYFIFGLFLAIILILSKSFLPATPQLSQVAGIMGGTPSKVSEEEFKNFFFHLSLIQAFFAGLISGQMGEGSITAGFKHSFILMVATLVCFQLFLSVEPFANKIAGEILRTPPNVVMTTASAPYTVTQSTTTAEILDIVKKGAREKRLGAFNQLTPADIRFVANSDCKACAKGDIIVNSNMLTVKRPSKIVYTLSGRKGKYDVFIGGS
jgi:flagellar protein FlaJ